MKKRLAMSMGWITLDFWFVTCTDGMQDIANAATIYQFNLTVAPEEPALIDIAIPWRYGTLIDRIEALRREP